MHESRFSHAADGQNPAGDAHLRLIGKLFRGFRAIFGENRWDGVRKLELLAVGAESKGGDVGGAAHALVEKIVFKGHVGFFSLARLRALGPRELP